MFLLTLQRLAPKCSQHVQYVCYMSYTYNHIPLQYVVFPSSLYFSWQPIRAVCGMPRWCYFDFICKYTQPLICPEGDDTIPLLACHSHVCKLCVECVAMFPYYRKKHHIVTRRADDFPKAKFCFPNKVWQYFFLFRKIIFKFFFFCYRFVVVLCGQTNLMHVWHKIHTRLKLLKKKFGHADVLTPGGAAGWLYVHLKNVIISVLAYIW